MKEHTGKNKIFIVIIICLCAVIIAGLIYFMKLKGGSDSAFKPDLDPNAKTQTADDTGEKPTGIRIPGYPSITIEADKKDVQMNLMNPEGNPCYFTFEIVLNDTDETIYTSKMVEPGKAITEVTLDKALAAGEYPATIKITTASLTDGSAMNGANVETNTEMVGVIKELATEVKYMRGDLNETIERLNKLESKDGDKWEKFKWLIVAGLVTLILGYLAVSIGLK